MLIGGFALGATHGLRLFPRRVSAGPGAHCAGAIAQAEEHGLLGENILGSGFSFHIKIKEGAGAFVCGEETALIASIEGQRGMPRPRRRSPPLPGLWGKPTVINNVETLANVPPIMRHGADWFAHTAPRKARAPRCLPWSAR